jgi:menaquinone-dependent protoporphyrinogen oxidase
MKPILIALISPSGSTREIAEHLRRTFEKAGRSVAVSDLSSPLDWNGYAAVVVAAPIHGMRWMPEAAAFVSAHHSALRERPAALVAVSYLYFEGRANWKATITKNLEAVRSPLPHASVQVFGGRLPRALPAPARWLFGVKPNRPLDLVDAAAVSSWAQAWVRTVS